MSYNEFYKPKRWEGKSFSFKLKYACANYPEMCIMALAFGVVAPAIIAYRWMTYDNCRDAYISKYKKTYIVIRDDDPRVDEFIKEREAGRHLFPKY